MWTIRKIEDSENPAHSAWQMYQRLPRFLKELSGFKDGDFELFESKFYPGLNFVGVSFDSDQVIVHGERKNENVIEGHLFCKKDVDKGLVASTILFATREALKEAPQVVVETSDRHRFLCDLLERCGYTDIGVTVYRGKRLGARIFVIKR